MTGTNSASMFNPSNSRYTFISIIVTYPVARLCFCQCVPISIQLAYSSAPKILNMVGQTLSVCWLNKKKYSKPTSDRPILNQNPQQQQKCGWSGMTKQLFCCLVQSYVMMQIRSTTDHLHCNCRGKINMLTCLGRTSKASNGHVNNSCVYSSD